MSIHDYMDEAQERGRRRKSLWNLLLIPFAIVGMLGAYFLFLQCIHFIERIQLPADTILFGNSRIGNLFIFLFLVFLSIPWGLIFANIIAFCIPPLRKVLVREAQGHKGASFKEANNALLKMAAILTLTMVPLSLVGAMDCFYVKGEGVTKRSIFSQKKYEWGDIKTIYVACKRYRNKSSWQLSLKYKLHMSDGVDIELWQENHDRFADAYDQIAGYINNQKDIVYQMNITPDGLRFIEHPRYTKIRSVLQKIVQQNSPA